MNTSLAHIDLVEATAKTHVTQVLLKPGVRDRVQGTVLAHRSGLVDRRG